VLVTGPLLRGRVMAQDWAFATPIPRLRAAKTARIIVFIFIFKSPDDGPQQLAERLSCFGSARRRLDYNAVYSPRCTSAAHPIRACTDETYRFRLPCTTETIVNPIVREGLFWAPITPQTGSFFHAESQKHIRVTCGQSVGERINM
jgi:hypothetical protein